MKFFLKIVSRLLLVGAVSGICCLCMHDGIVYAGPPAHKQMDKKKKEKLYKGSLDFINSDGRMVINDMMFNVDSGTRYLHVDGTPAELSAFSKHDQVLFRADRDRVIEVLKIFKKTASKVKVNNSSAKARSEQKLYYENGVWKNR